MPSSAPVPTSLERLIEREVERSLRELEESNPQGLAENPEGSSLIADALRDSIWLGLDAGCTLESCSVGELDSGRKRAWEDWWHLREETPEARAWPGLLAAGAPEVLDRADDLLAGAAAELNLRGRSSRNLRRAGVQAAEAGAALARALSRVPAAPQPEGAVPAPIGAVQPDGIVRVATVANQAEGELLQGILEAAGIPSTWRRTGGDLPGLLAAGYREIYVPEDAADDARAVLATSDLDGAEDEPSSDARPTRKVGLERRSLRLIGQATAVLVILTLLWEATTGLELGAAVTLALVAVLFATVAAMVSWGRTA
jgi:hypothetical protein